MCLHGSRVIRSARAGLEAASCAWTDGGVGSPAWRRRRSGRARCARRPAGSSSTLDGGAGRRAIRGDRDDVFSHGFLCPKGVGAEGSCTRTPTGCARRWCAADGDSCRGDAGTRRSREIDARLRPIIEAARARRGRRVPRQPERAQPRRRCSTAASLAQGARHAQRLHREHRRPDAQAGLRRADVRRRADDPGPRPRPHRLPADPRREPARVQRQPDDGARHARPAARDPRARRQGRRGRPAAHAHRRGRPTSTTSSGRAPTRCCCSAMVARAASTRASSTRPARRAHRRARRGRARSRAPFTPERRGRGVRHRRRRRSGGWRASSPARRARRRLRPRSARARRSSARSRRWLVDVLNVLTGNLDRAGRRDVPARRRGRAQHAGRAGPRAGACSSAAGTSRVRGLPEVLRRAARSACLAEEIETPGEGQIRALVTRRRQPGASARRTRAGSTRALGVARLHGGARHLPQRDDAPRRRDPARAVAARALALRPRALPARVRNVANYSPPVLAAGRRRCRTSGRSCCGWRRSPPGQGADSDVDALDDLVALEVLRARAPTSPARRVAGATPTKLLAALEPRAGRSALLDVHAAHRPVRRRLRRGPTG